MSEPIRSEQAWEFCGPARWEDVDPFSQWVARLFGGGPEQAGQQRGVGE